MKVSWIAVAALVAGFGVLAADPALARSKHHGKHPAAHAAQRQCVNNPPQISLHDWFFAVRPHPQRNGCSPPVYVSGEFIGQDPDANVRHTLQRDPDQGYRMKH